MMKTRAVDPHKTLYFPDIHSEESLFLERRRPSFVLERIASGYSHAQNLTASNYAKIGDKVYQFTTGLTSDVLLEKCLQGQPDKKMKVLDIGTGNGLYVKNLSDRNPTFTVLGISAIDMRGELEIPGNQYMITNAETIIEDGSLDESSWDLIVSSYAFMHFMDPLRTLADLYRLLAPRGVICIDLFTAKGLEGYVDKWIDYLHQNGYLVASEYSQKQINRGQCEFILIQKTHPTLTMPFFYDKDVSLNDSGPVSYQIDHTRIPYCERKIHSIRKSSSFGVFDPISEMDFFTEIKLPPGWKGILEPEEPSFL